jgi:hypothetical protein
MRTSRIWGVLGVAVALTACSNGTIFKKSAIGDVELLSIDARQRLVLNGKDADGKRIVCTEPSPDAIVAQAAAFAASGSYSTKAKAGIAASLSESAGSIAMRTQTIQLLRDGYYRLCEARLNLQIDEDDYKWALRFIDEFIVTVAAIEALGGTVVAPAITIGAEAKATGNQDSPSAGGETPPNSGVGAVTVNANDMSPEQAEAIKSIVAEYYKRKMIFLSLMLVVENQPDKISSVLPKLMAAQGVGG